MTIEVPNMLKRKIYDKICDWKDNMPGKCLIVEGARQVGKTYIVRQFAKENFASYIELNFIETPSLSLIFSGDIDSETILSNIGLYLPKSEIIPGNTLLFLDEIQECEKAVSALKFLAADPRIRVVCSGSALGMAFKGKTSYPVGSIEYLKLHALDFEEFLWAMGIKNDVIDKLKNCANHLEKVPVAIHEKMNMLLKQYMVLGGMPEVIQNFVDTNNYAQADKIQRRLYRDYINDIARYADPEIKIKAEKCYKTIPAQLSKDNHKFQYSVVEDRGTAAKFKTSVDWLEKAHIVNIVTNVKTILYPLKTVEMQENYRMYPSDIGFLMATYQYELKAAILNDHCFEKKSPDIILGTTKGGMYEALACEILAKAGFNEVHFYRNESGTIEIEFIVEGQDGIVPIEIKAGKSKSKSLTSVLEDEKIAKGYKFSLNNVGSAEKKRTLPLYLLPFMKF